MRSQPATHSSHVARNPDGLSVLTSQQSRTIPDLIYSQFYFLYVMKSRICLGKGVFRPTSKIFLSAFPAESL